LDENEEFRIDNIQEKKKYKTSIEQINQLMNRYSLNNFDILPQQL